MTITFAIPSKGAIAEPTYQFLKECGLKTHKPNPRQYVGVISGLTDVNVLYQRAKDVVYKVSDGTAQFGISGYDIVYENPHEDLIIVKDKLGYGGCKLVVAVPEAWIDVNSMRDLAEIALQFKESKGRNLRVATTYSYSARKFLHSHNIHHFTIVKADGAIEAAPTIGYADIVIDLTQTGTTLRENYLKEINDGTIIESEACLIANKQQLLHDPKILDTLRVLCEYIDATLNGKNYMQITVNIAGDSAEEIAKKVSQNQMTRGLLGPTISPVYSVQDNKNTWYSVTITVPDKKLLQVVEFLRSIKAKQVVVCPVHYVFLDHSITYRDLCDTLGM
ncbi:ATP phosphoribosyltransferase [Anaerolineales bacterium]